jgi:hypothetical protein
MLSPSIFPILYMHTCKLRSGEREREKSRISNLARSASRIKEGGRKMMNERPSPSLAAQDKKGRGGARQHK